ncbi:MAG: geranylgeranylglycerol-phosphate geranylgeranyltransferase [Lentisphaeria bacterium]|nr:geranylgeranylglycerol-phosphate geranylgeranyltransferase [Candidatus Neomarinimicrobiota bacterium]MCF7842424.1 geranylgeranylglycerol-phosphate geranylgeranyltransferase [Lentisphaeria bacterium]
MEPWIKILRPLNLFQAVLAVLLATYILEEIHQTQILLFLLLSVVTINGAGNVINDIYDLEIDRINRPDRPLPGSDISVPTAWIYTTILFVIGILASALINWQTFIITTFIATPLLVGYSRWFKRMPLVGNVVVAVMLGLTFVYVGAAFGNFPLMLPLAGLAFGFTIIREIIKDLEDEAGDVSAGAHTLPIMWGQRAVLRFVTLLIVIFLIADLSPYWLGIYNRWYLIFVIVGVNLPLLSALIFLWVRPEKSTFRRVQLFLKYDIFIGLLAILLGT